MLKVSVLFLFFFYSNLINAEPEVCKNKAYLITQYLDLFENQKEISLLSTISSTLKRETPLNPGILTFLNGYIEVNYPLDENEIDEGCLSNWTLITQLKQLHNRRILNSYPRNRIPHSEALHTPLFTEFDDYFLERIKIIAKYHQGHLIIIKKKPSKELLSFLSKRSNYTLYQKTLPNQQNIYRFNTIFDIAANEFRQNRMKKNRVLEIFKEIDQEEINVHLQKDECSHQMAKNNYDDLELKKMERILSEKLNVFCSSLKSGMQTASKK